MCWLQSQSGGKESYTIFRYIHFTRVLPFYATLYFRTLLRFRWTFDTLFPSHLFGSRSYYFPFRIQKTAHSKRSNQRWPYKCDLIQWICFGPLLLSMSCEQFHLKAHPLPDLLPCVFWYPCFDHYHLQSVVAASCTVWRYRADRISTDRHTDRQTYKHLARYSKLLWW